MANKEPDDLAKGQGGKTQNRSYVHASTSGSSEVLPDKRKDLASFLERGEEILETFSQSIQGFEAQTLQIKELSATVNTIQARLKRKHVEENQDNENESRSPCQKRRESATDQSLDDKLSDVSWDSGDEIDRFALDTEPNNSDNEDLSCIEEFKEFFEEEQTVGDKVSDVVATAINKSLRCQVDAEKMRKLMQHYRRPENIDNLQVPRVDTFLWDQLKTSTKSQDVGRQKTIGIINQAIVPLVRALDYTNKMKTPDIKMLTTYVKDSVKMMCGEVNKLNQQRREIIKKEIFPKFRHLCSDGQPVSATGLFGDNLAEETKNLDSTKGIQMTNKGITNKGSGQKNFLFKRRGEKPTEWRQQSQHRYPPLDTQKTFNATWRRPMFKSKGSGSQSKGDRKHYSQKQ